jgi:hypothetical protein
MMGGSQGQTGGGQGQSPWDDDDHGVFSVGGRSRTQAQPLAVGQGAGRVHIRRATRSSRRMFHSSNSHSLCGPTWWIENLDDARGLGRLPQGVVMGENQRRAIGKATGD